MTPQGQWMDCGAPVGSPTGMAPCPLQCSPDEGQMHPMLPGVALAGGKMAVQAPMGERSPLMGMIMPQGCDALSNEQVAQMLQAAASVDAYED